MKAKLQTISGPLAVAQCMGECAMEISVSILYCCPYVMHLATRPLPAERRTRLHTCRHARNACVVDFTIMVVAVLTLRQALTVPNSIVAPNKPVSRTLACSHKRQGQTPMVDLNRQPDVTTQTLDSEGFRSSGQQFRCLFKTVQWDSPPTRIPTFDGLCCRRICDCD